MPGIGAYTGGSFNLGRDISLITTINGTSYKYVGLTLETDRKAISKEHEVIPTINDAVPIRRATYEGFELDMTFARQDGTFDYLVDALQQGYFTGQAPPTITVYETVRNPNGGADQWQYTGGIMLPESLGHFKGAEPVNNVTLKMKFSQRIQVSGATTATSNINSPQPFG